MGEWLERHRIPVLSVLAVLVAAGLAFLWLNRPRPRPVVISTPVPTFTPTAFPTPTPASLRVYVTGAVHRPDVYDLSHGSIVKDALSAAGGATDDADLTRINLALELYDQQQVYVPCTGEDAPPVSPPAQPSPAVRAGVVLVNINAASAAELEALPGVGPAIAQRILDYRGENGPFATVEEIMEVKGIGPATYEKLKDQITVQ